MSMPHNDETEARILQQLISDSGLGEEWQPRIIAPYLCHIPEYLGERADDPVTMSGLYEIQADFLKYALDELGLGSHEHELGVVDRDKLLELAADNVSFTYRQPKVIFGAEVARLFWDGKLTYAELFRLRPGAFLPTYQLPE